METGFWSQEIKPNETISLDITTHMLRLTTANLGLFPSETEQIGLFCEIENETFLLCKLQKPNIEQIRLDLVFYPNNKLSFFTKGNLPIFLLGYLEPFRQEIKEIKTKLNK
ncbi:histone deacetylase hdt3-like isoform x1 [Anaeramoeba ignava]|uniref:Histone deacetylase hdt3-like isoform x1 n=1 Tax=Anaeramoeba ignava TaxID=1746090 RepID=A0A9Q0LXF6_ANAIG|nr:histone deacetylase hdt3-like isoform x1 [Anaeramoeba ignava]